jgi:hypothetical protein
METGRELWVVNAAAITAVIPLYSLTENYL